MRALVFSLIFASPVTAFAQGAVHSAAMEQHFAPEMTDEQAAAAADQAWRANNDKMEAIEAAAAAKLARIAAIEARIADGKDTRLPLEDYLVLLQRHTCAAAYGDVTQGPGAGCLSQPSPTENQANRDDEDIDVCAEYGGVLVERMSACTEASTKMAKVFNDAGDTGPNLGTMMAHLIDVARACWGRTLCVQ